MATKNKASFKIVVIKIVTGVYKDETFTESKSNFSEVLNIKTDMWNIIFTKIKSNLIKFLDIKTNNILKDNPLK